MVCKSLLVLAAAMTIGCASIATGAEAAGHAGHRAGHAAGGHGYFAGHGGGRHSPAVMTVTAIMAAALLYQRLMAYGYDCGYDPGAAIAGSVLGGVLNGFGPF